MSSPIAFYGEQFRRADDETYALMLGAWRDRR
jgi:hypothetical protein